MAHGQVKTETKWENYVSRFWPSCGPFWTSTWGHT